MPFNAMLDVNLTIFGTAHATRLERMEGYAPAVLTNHDVNPGDVVIVISTSGVNAVPIELAEAAKRSGAVIVAVTSADAYRDVPSRHSSGRKLADVADIVLDTRVPEGDAVVPIGDASIRVGATSTILGATLLNLLVVETARLLDQAGQPVPAFISQNVPGGDAHNASLIERYGRRLPLMKP
ncbi:MAG TPA: sugar isomerase domain-containing protein [Thermomicrobiales bacterium]|nr:sugar isomerase domain-containing protein [Thermomicrobiales bacterium]